MDTLKYDQKINGYFLTISNRGNAISNFITIYFFYRTGKFGLLALETLLFISYFIAQNNHFGNTYH